MRSPTAFGCADGHAGISPITFPPMSLIGAGNRLQLAFGEVAKLDKARVLQPLAG